MKVLPFTILVPTDKSVISEAVEMPHFYSYLHRHDECQLTWIEEGEGTLITGTNMHTFKPGDIFFIGVNLPHLFKSNPEYFQPDSGLKIKACSLYINPVTTLGGLFNLPEMKACRALIENNQYGFKLPEAYTNLISEKMMQVHHAQGLDVLRHFLDLFADLNRITGLEPLCPMEYSLNISENDGIRLSNILGYIMQNHRAQIGLDDVAEVAHMTPQAFCRYFKKHTRRNFISFLNEIRINEACKSLTDDSKITSISDAAYTAGFNSITNFNRVFKNVVGQTPREYIEAYHTVSHLN